jgi:hypothetical protein
MLKGSFSSFSLQALDKKGLKDIQTTLEAKQV